MFCLNCNTGMKIMCIHISSCLILYNQPLVPENYYCLLCILPFCLKTKAETETNATTNIKPFYNITNDGKNQDMP